MAQKAATMRTANSEQRRSVFLDTSKGLAIILVVLGHTFQYCYPVGLESFPFRFIYSFHMPLFIALSGMVFSLKIKALPDENFNIYSELKKSACGLLVPFVSWTVIFALTKNRDNMLGYFIGVIKRPDRSLWFLPALFFCRISFALIQKLFARFSSSKKIFMFLVFAACVLLDLRIRYSKTYLSFFVLGIYAYKFRARLTRFLDNSKLNAIMIILFLALVPFWYFTSPSPSELWLSQFVPARRARFMYNFFKLTFPVMGIYNFILLVKLLLNSGFKKFIEFLSFTGKMTLGIYAIHSSIIHLPPMFFGPLLVSMILTFIIQKIPVIKFLLLGK